MRLLALAKGACQPRSCCTSELSLLNLGNLEGLLRCSSSRWISTTLRLEHGRDRKHTFRRWEHVSCKTHRWELQKSMKEIYGYTTEPVPLPRLGGRGPNGRVWDWRVGGGFQKHVYMVDWVRGGPSSGEPLVERVLEIKTDDCKSARLALVAHGEKKRWIIASSNMKVGDLIKSSTDKSITNLKFWNEGDSLPLACVPQGSVVHCIQNFPGSDGRITCAAGSLALVVRHIDDKVVVRLPSKQEIMISNACTAVLGRAAAKHETREKMYKAGQKRWLGVRPRTGLYHKKTGHQGRKGNQPRKLKEYSDTPTPPGKKLRRLFNDVSFT